MKRTIVNELLKRSVLTSMLKNKFCFGIIQKTINYINEDDKAELKDYLTKKLKCTSNQEKSRILTLLEIV